MSDPNFEGLEEVKSQWIKWGKVGDWIRGTLTDVREMDSNLPGKTGKVKVYEFLAHGGSFHDLDEKKNPVAKATVLEKGAIWIIGGKAGIDTQMRNVKLGQIFGMRFAAEKPSKTKGFNPTKVIKVLIGGMDPDYQGQTGGDINLKDIPMD